MDVLFAIILLIASLWFFLKVAPRGIVKYSPQWIAKLNDSLDTLKRKNDRLSNSKPTIDQALLRFKSLSAINSKTAAKSEYELSDSLLKAAGWFQHRANGRLEQTGPISLKENDYTKAEKTISLARIYKTGFIALKRTIQLAFVDAQLTISNALQNDVSKSVEAIEEKLIQEQHRCESLREETSRLRKALAEIGASDVAIIKNWIGDLGTTITQLNKLHSRLEATRSIEERVGALDLLDEADATVADYRKLIEETQTKLPKLDSRAKVINEELASVVVNSRVAGKQLECNWLIEWAKSNMRDFSKFRSDGKWDEGMERLDRADNAIAIYKISADTENKLNELFFYKDIALVETAQAIESIGNTYRQELNNLRSSSLPKASTVRRKFADMNLQIDSLTRQHEQDLNREREKASRALEYLSNTLRNLPSLPPLKNDPIVKEAAIYRQQISQLETPRQFHDFADQANTTAENILSSRRRIESQISIAETFLEEVKADIYRTNDYARSWKCFAEVNKILRGFQTQAQDFHKRISRSVNLREAFDNLNGITHIAHEYRKELSGLSDRYNHFVAQYSRLQLLLEDTRRYANSSLRWACLQQRRQEMIDMFKVIEADSTLLPTRPDIVDVESQLAELAKSAVKLDLVSKRCSADVDSLNDRVELIDEFLKILKEQISIDSSTAASRIVKQVMDMVSDLIVAAREKYRRVQDSINALEKAWQLALPLMNPYLAANQAARSVVINGGNVFGIQQGDGTSMIINPNRPSDPL
jgi:hypothetical protein